MKCLHVENGKWQCSQGNKRQTWWGGIISISFRQAAENSTSDEITHRHSQVNKPNTCALVFAVGNFPSVRCIYACMATVASSGHSMCSSDSVEITFHQCARVWPWLQACLRGVRLISKPEWLSGPGCFLITLLAGFWLVWNFYWTSHTQQLVSYRNVNGQRSYRFDFFLLCRCQKFSDEIWTKNRNTSLYINIYILKGSKEDGGFLLSFAYWKTTLYIDFVNIRGVAKCLIVRVKKYFVGYFFTVARVVFGDGFVWCKVSQQGRQWFMCRAGGRLHILLTQSSHPKELCPPKYTKQTEGGPKQDIK